MNTSGRATVAIAAFFTVAFAVCGAVVLGGCDGEKPMTRVLTIGYVFAGEELQFSTSSTLEGYENVGVVHVYMPNRPSKADAYVFVGSPSGSTSRPIDLEVCRELMNAYVGAQSTNGWTTHEVAELPPAPSG